MFANSALSKEMILGDTMISVTPFRVEYPTSRLSSLV